MKNFEDADSSFGDISDDEFVQSDDHEDAEIITNCCKFSRDLKRLLSDILDADYGLLEELGCALDDRQYSSLRQFNGYDRNDKLMEIVHLLHQDEFLKALRETGQQHIVNFVEHELSGKAANVNETCWPLTKMQRNILKSNRSELAKSIDTNSLLPILFSSNCITEVHFDRISAEKTRYDCNVCLLEILLKRSQADYLRFIQGLRESGQDHLAVILAGDGGGVVAVRAVLAESDSEKEVVARFRQLWKGASSEKRQQINGQLGLDMEIIDIRESSSVAVFFLCKTLSAIQRLAAMIEDGTLMSVVGEIFSMILDGRHVEIVGIDFYVSSYNSCLHFFYKAMGLYDKFYACDPHDVTDVIAQRECSLSIKDLPLELLEIMLVKAVVLIFKHLMKLGFTDADSCAIAMILMVCRDWRLVFEERPFIKIQVEVTLDYMCRPLRRHIGSCCQRVVVPGEDGGNCLLAGVATLDSQLFAVSRPSSTVCVFELTSFTRLQNIELKGLLRVPYDIATCEVTRRIYIADDGSRCVWLIDWSPRSTAASSFDSPPAVEFIECEGYAPRGLSTSGRRQQLLVISGENSLYVYDVDGYLLRRVKLLTAVGDDGVRWYRVNHAVQATTGDNYLVCRIESYLQQWTQAEVAEYNSTGQRLRSYHSGPRGDRLLQDSEPVYMSLIDDGHLIVADIQGRRVLLLNAELKLERVLVTSQQLNFDGYVFSLPWRLCYNSQTGLLCVASLSGHVNVYKIT